MRRSTKPLAIVTCLSLLILQLSGVHVHANDSGYIGAPETPFTHSHDHHDAHHAGDEGAGPVSDGEEARDVDLLDLALSLFKMPLAIMALVLLFVLFPNVRALVRLEFVRRILSGRHTRWRPPLRAPPQPA